MSVPHPALPSYTDAKQLDIRAISHTFALAFQRPQATQKQGNKNVMNLTLYKLNYATQHCLDVAQPQAINVC